MKKVSTYVGLDVHKDTIVVSLLFGDGRKSMEWQAPNDARGVRRMVRKLEQESGGEIECAYEAGPCGYALQRQLRAAGIGCQVVAPSLIPIKPGERIKTDRRDARKPAEHLRAGLLTEVHPPSEADEAVRDLCRCREDAKEDLMRVRHRLSKMLLRRSRVYRAGRNWTKRHRPQECSASTRIGASRRGETAGQRREPASGLASGGPSGARGNPFLDGTGAESWYRPFKVRFTKPKWEISEYILLGDDR